MPPKAGKKRRLHLYGAPLVTAAAHTATRQTAFGAQPPQRESVPAPLQGPAGGDRAQNFSRNVRVTP